MIKRPRKRGDCENGIRPCPWVGCRHHLGIDVHPRTGRVTQHPGWWERETCSLDVADRGAHSFRQLGAILGCSGQAIGKQYLEMKPKLARRMKAKKLTIGSLGADLLEAGRAARDWMDWPSIHNGEKKEYRSRPLMRRPEDRLSRLCNMIARRLFGDINAEEAQ